MELEDQPEAQLQSPINIGALSPTNVDVLSPIQTDTTTPIETHIEGRKGTEVADSDEDMLKDKDYSPSESYHSKHSMKSND